MRLQNENDKIQTQLQTNFKKQQTMNKIARRLIWMCKSWWIRHHQWISKSNRNFSGFCTAELLLLWNCLVPKKLTIFQTLPLEIVITVKSTNNTCFHTEQWLHIKLTCVCVCGCVPLGGTVSRCVSVCRLSNKRVTLCGKRLLKYSPTTRNRRNAFFDLHNQFNSKSNNFN